MLSRISKSDGSNKAAFMIKKGKTNVSYFNIFLSPQGHSTIKSFLDAFPEVISYLQANADKWRDRFLAPKLHDVDHHSDEG